MNIVFNLQEFLFHRIHFNFDFFISFIWMLSTYTCVCNTCVSTDSRREDESRVIYGYGGPGITEELPCRCWVLNRKRNSGRGTQNKPVNESWHTETRLCTITSSINKKNCNSVPFVFASKVLVESRRSKNASFSLSLMMEKLKCKKMVLKSQNLCKIMFWEGIKWQLR